jgi:hypothetical protein
MKIAGVILAVLFGFVFGLWTASMIDGGSPFKGPRSPDECAAILRADGDETYHLGAYCQGSAIYLAQQYLKEHPELLTEVKQ